MGLPYLGLKKLQDDEIIRKRSMEIMDHGIAQGWCTSIENIEII